MQSFDRYWKQRIGSPYLCVFANYDAVSSERSFQNESQANEAIHKKKEIRAKYLWDIFSVLIAMQKKLEMRKLRLIIC